MTGIHGQKGGEMLQYLEMSAVVPAGFSLLAHERSRFAHLKRENAYLRSKNTEDQKGNEHYGSTYDQQRRRKTVKGTWFFK